MSRNLDENWFNTDIRIFRGQARQEIKLLLDLLDCFTLICDDFKGRRELTLADQRHHLHGCLLLLLTDEVRVLARSVLE